MFGSNNGLKNEPKWRVTQIRATAQQIERTKRLRNEANNRRDNAESRLSQARSRKEHATRRLAEATRQVERARQHRDETASHEAEAQADSKSSLKDHQDAVVGETTALANERKAIADEQKALADEHKAIADKHKAIADEHKAIADEHKAIADEQKALADEHEAQADIAAAQRDYDSARNEENRILPSIPFPEFIDYMGYWHYLVYSRLLPRYDPYRAYRGVMANPQAKLCPPRLRPWTTILEEQRFTMGKLMSNYDMFPRLFRGLVHPPCSASMLRDMADSITSEDAFLGNVVNLMLASHLQFILSKPEDVDLVTGLVDRDKRLLFSKGPFEHGRWDHLYVYKNHKECSSENIAYLIECRSHEALRLPLLRVGLRPMDVYKDVVCRKPPVSDDEVALFQYRAEKLVAAAVTQTFDYMVQGAMTYGCIMTEEAIVFLKIDWDTSPVTLLYHLAEPGAEVDAHQDDFVCCTALSQMLTFTQAAFDPHTRKRRSQDQIHKAVADLKLWAVDYDNIFHSIPEKMLWPPSDSPAKVPRTYADVDRTPFVSETAHVDALPSGSSGADVTSPEPGLRQYCTHKCLVGLVNGTTLDDECPNVGLHRPTRKKQQPTRKQDLHPVSYAAWQERLRAQLKKTLDNGLVRLEKQEPAGATLQVTMLEYGYTFIAKAVTEDFVHTLHHEVAVYERLKPLQGDKVPVCLGGIDLRDFGRTYYYCIGVKLVYFMFMSWGGIPLSMAKGKIRDRPKVVRGVVDALNAVHNHRVVHKNVHVGNLLWDAKTENVMVIDFDGALLPTRVQKSLVPVLSRKRPRSDSTKDGSDSDHNLKGSTSKRDEVVFNTKWLDLQFAHDPRYIFSYF